MTGRAYTPQARIEGWTGRCHRLGKSKEVFDAELFTFYQVAKTSGSRNESGQDYHPVGFNDGNHTRYDAGPGQRFAIATREACSRLLSWGSNVALRWVPSHEGIGGNEAADGWAREAAESVEDSVARDSSTKPASPI